MSTPIQRTAWPGRSPAERDPAAAGDVEDGRAVGQLGDRSEAAIEGPRIDSPHCPEDQPREEGAFDVEVVDRSERPCAYVSLLGHRRGSYVSSGMGTKAIQKHEAGLSWVMDESMQRASHALVDGDDVWLIDPVDEGEAIKQATALGRPRGHAWAPVNRQK